MTREQPRQNPPPVQRLRIRYAKRGRLRFTSHRDVSRAVERAVVRARIPMAYSSGFNPHPRISYAGAAPTGAASEAEYLELALAEHREPDAVRALLDDALPGGLDVVDVVDVAAPGAAAGGLADRLAASRWRLVVAAPGADAGAAVEAFLASDAIAVERMTKKGLRSFDCRAAVLRLAVMPDAAEPDVVGPSDRVVLDLVLRHAEPMVRPDDVLTGLAEVGGLAMDAAPLLTRLAQGPVGAADGSIGDPLRADETPRESS